MTGSNVPGQIAMRLSGAMDLDQCVAVATLVEQLEPEVQRPAAVTFGDDARSWGEYIARSGDIFRELQRRSPGRYQPLQIRTHEQRHAENTSLPGTETFEEQWQEEVIRGPFSVPISPAERSTRNS